MEDRKKSTLMPIKNTKILLDEISEEEKNLAREVWMQVELNYVVISKGLFSELFARHPEYKNFFKDLLAGEGKVKISEEVWLTPRFERHMVQVLMPALSNIVRNLASPEHFHSYLTKLGRLHRSKRMGLTPENVENLKVVFLETLKHTLGPSYTPNKQSAMMNVFSAAFHVFEEQLKM